MPITKTRLKETLSITWVVSQFILIGTLAFVTFYLYGMSTSDFTTCTAIVAPLFVAQTSLIVRYYVKNPHEKQQNDEDALNLPIVVITALGTLGFILLVASAIFAYAYGKISNIEHLKILLSTAEVVFGGIVTPVMTSLFDGGAPARSAASEVAQLESP